MKLQLGDYVGAEQLQQQLLKLNPKDKVLKEFNKVLPGEAIAQMEEEVEGYEYYDEEEDEDEPKEDKGETGEGEDK